MIMRPKGLIIGKWKMRRIRHLEIFDLDSGTGVGVPSRSGSDPFESAAIAEAVFVDFDIGARKIAHRGFTLM
jgi:hypothetical protein